MTGSASTRCPHAILQLRQGFGRLIRSRDDTGRGAILDTRLRTRGPTAAGSSRATALPGRLRSRRRGRFLRCPSVGRSHTGPGGLLATLSVVAKKKRALLLRRGPYRRRAPDGDVRQGTPRPAQDEADVPRADRRRSSSSRLAAVLAIALGGGDEASAEVSVGGCVRRRRSPSQGRKHAEPLPTGYKYNSFPPTSGSAQPGARDLQRLRRSRRCRCCSSTTSSTAPSSSSTAIR